MGQGTRLERLIPLPWLVSAIGASVALLALMMMALDLNILLNTACAGFGVTAAVLLLVRHLFRETGPRPHRATRDFAENILLFVTMGLAGAVASYVAAACTQGWVDNSMVALDHVMGFDWRDLYRLTAAHPALQISGRIAYASIYASPTILILAFARSGQRVEARLFLSTFWVAAVLSLGLFVFMPTLGPLAHMWQGAIPYMPTSGVYQAELIPLLREHQFRMIDLGQLRGLVGPPSFHACCAVMYILSARHTGPLRAPLTLLNVAMLLAIPVEGTHYMVDLVGGAAVALAAHALVTILARSLPAQPIAAPPQAVVIEAAPVATPYTVGVAAPVSGRTPEGVA